MLDQSSKRLLSRRCLLFTLAVAVTTTMYQFRVVTFRVDTTSAADALDSAKSTSQPVAIVPGELPGYTGWVRPTYTSAPFYQVSYSKAATAQINELWKFAISCQHTTCRDQNPKFYVRAYGPSVISAIVEPPSKKSRSSEHSVSLMIRDPGVYWVEVVLEFSNAPPLASYPNSDETPGYEGYLLPGTPFQLMAVDDEVSTNKQMAPCTVEEMTVHDMNEGYYKNRWVVTDKVNVNKDIAKRNISYSSQEKMSFHGYVRNINSIGIFMDLKPTTCELVKDATSPCFRDLHFIFIGDSVMMGKHTALLERIQGGANITISFIPVYYRGGGGLGVALPAIKKALNLVKISNPEKTCIFFNSGAHEIFGCSQIHKEEWKKLGFPTNRTFSCSSLYKTRFQRLVEIVDAHPAKIKVFASTHALWPRWGNWGFSWPLNDNEQTQRQRLPLTSHMAAHFNNIAFSEISSKFKSIHIVDEYWLTLARPDDREKNGGPTSVLGHLVHPGFEVYDVMMRQLLTIVLAVNVKSSSCQPSSAEKSI